MLRRPRPENLAALLRRLDATVHLALEEGERTDEINLPTKNPRQSINRPAQEVGVIS